jgi:hypothetical protein
MSGFRPTIPGDERKARIYPHHRALRADDVSHLGVRASSRGLGANLVVSPSSRHREDDRGNIIHDAPLLID